MNNKNTKYRYNKNNIWLPYTQMKNVPVQLPVKKTEGVYIELENGDRLIDGISSWWSVCHGYNHPYILDAMKNQMDDFSHIMFAGFAHQPAYLLSEKIAKISPSGLQRVFFSDSGSTAVEVALKMSVQFWKNKGQGRRDRFITFFDGYHGDTMGCMSVSDTESGMHKVYSSYMPKQYTVPIPSDEYGFAEFEEVVAAVAKNVAALIIEPLVQGSGGFKFHSADVLAEIYRICKKYDILFVADEIMTGFGRTGMMFACEEAGVTPDILCLGKALTGGAIGLAATVTTERVFEAFLSDELSYTFMHGPTFMANPTACAAAVASIDLFEKEPRLEQIQKIEEQLIVGLKDCKKLANVKNVRVKGAIGVVQLHNADWNMMFAMREKFIKQDVFLRPFADVVYIMPPFIISQPDLQKLIDSVFEVLKG